MQTLRLLFGRTSYNRPTRFINEISSDLLTYQGLARPANSSLKHPIVVEVSPLVKA